MADNWYIGNAHDDSETNRGWILGHFMDSAAGGVRRTEDLEVKWGIHPAGQQREWTTGSEHTCLVILVEGKFYVDMSVGVAALTRQGDYVVYGPGIDHRWRAETDSIVVSVRWPSTS
ncbi:signal peptidase I [Nonomuraea endophytica]|uniref:Quercetin dioxygenase-like cupin family protein n=1 Tax=Nonomuraea endophytica TaxID=714136 RepID=A0A7W8EKN7_9ACTN|nr:signal peptidase I [Nonomuraea endophytica]MBB5082989.1 quercetin dioxygenase-like cupin family protein [Nonomuraea endophytica]